MKHFETDLPAGYREAFTIDAANKKTGVTLNLENSNPAGPSVADGPAGFSFWPAVRAQI